MADAPNGFYLGATIVDQVQDEMTLAREEVFGPVLNVMRMEDLDHAIEVANRSAYGNGTAIFTNSGKAAREFKHRVKAGMVGINVGVPATMAMFPFTGWDDSFYGDLHIQGKEAVQFYTQQKVITSRWFGEGVGDVWKIAPTSNRMKLQAPSSKLQRNIKHQTSMQRARLLSFVVWSFCGAWSLEFGASLMSLLIKGGEIVTGTEHYIADIYCEHERITHIDRNIDAPAGAEVINASGKYVFPGFIDPHVHIYLPFMGTFSKDTYETASKAALVGGTTTMIEMVCPSREMSAAEGFRLWQEQAAGKSACDYTYHMGVTRFDEENATQLREIVAAGISSFKIFLAYKGAFGIDDAELYQTLKLAKELGVIVTAHCENETLVAERQKELLAAGKNRTRATSREPAAARGSGRRPSFDDVCRTDRRACLHRPPQLRRSVARSALGPASRRECLDRDADSISRA